MERALIVCDNDKGTSFYKSFFNKFMSFLDKKDQTEAIVDRYRKFLKNKKELKTRPSVLIEWLSGLKMHGEELSTAEVVALLFRMYNPLLDSSQAAFAE